MILRTDQVEKWLQMSEIQGRYILRNDAALKKSQSVRPLERTSAAPNTISDAEYATKQAYKVFLTNWSVDLVIQKHLKSGNVCLCRITQQRGFLKSIVSFVGEGSFVLWSGVRSGFPAKRIPITNVTHIHLTPKHELQWPLVNFLCTNHLVLM